MKRRIFITFFIFLAVFAYGDDYSTIYNEINNLFLNPDPNIGLTTLPILLMPIGGKYEGMGTAFTAVADDGGFIEANPSASAILTNTELSLYHNDTISDSNMEGVIYTLRFNDLGLGFGGKFLYVPFTEYNTWGERVSRGYYSESVVTVNMSYNFFSSYYFYGLSLGTNLKVAVRYVPDVFSPEVSQSVAMAMADIGILTKFNILKFYPSRDRNFSFGAVVKNLGPYALGEPLPSETTVGIAYAPIRPMTLSFDFTLPFSFDPANFPAEKWNMASGVDIVFTDFFSVQGGFRIRGSNPRISLGSTIDLDNMTLTVNYTLDMTTQLGALDHFSIAAKFKLGDRGRGAFQAKIDDLYTAGLAEYAEGDLDKALFYLTQITELDPGFQPASELINIIRRSISLQKEMEAIKRVE